MNASAISHTESNTSPVSLQGASFMSFINAVKAPATKAAYELSLRRYLNHIKKTSTDDLLVNVKSWSTFWKTITNELTILSLKKKNTSLQTILIDECQVEHAECPVIYYKRNGMTVEYCMTDVIQMLNLHQRAGR
jgi:hypothetical protein